LAIIVFQKVIRVTAYHLYCNVCSECALPARMQVVDIHTTR